MRYLSCLPILTLAGLFLFACNADEGVLPVSGINVEQLVEEYNSELDPQSVEEDGAFVATGTVTGADILTNAEGEEQLTFTFTEEGARHTFNFHLEEAVEFPEAIDRAKVVFLGHQMIVADLDGKFFVHLHVPGGENLMPNLPYVKGSQLAMESQDGLFSTLLGQ